jgi:hypothetical protein
MGETGDSQFVEPEADPAVFVSCSVNEAAGQTMDFLKTTGRSSSEVGASQQKEKNPN